MNLNIENTLFSILVANYNNGKYFTDCYKSIIKQSYENWEVIILDDGSTDDSIEIIKNTISNDTRFKLFLNVENRGCGFTKSKCIKLANGEVLGFLDPDDALFENAIEVMMKAHTQYKEVALISSKYKIFDEAFNFLAEGNHGSPIPKDKSFLTYGKGAITHFATFKKLFYNLTEGINESLKRAVDQDLYLKLEEQGKHLFIEQFLYKYRIHKEGISQDGNKFKARYWHFVIVVEASKRRKRLKLKVDNFKDKELDLYKSRYYVIRLKRACNLKKYKSKYYFLIKAMWVCPSHRRRYKLKSFFIFNYA